MKILRCVVAIALLLAAGPVFAYLDPGTGSMLLQVLLGGFVALGVAITMYWYKIRAAFGLGKPADTEDETS